MLNKWQTDALITAENIRFSNCRDTTVWHGSSARVAKKLTVTICCIWPAPISYLLHTRDPREFVFLPYSWKHTLFRRFISACTARLSENYHDPRRTTYRRCNLLHVRFQWSNGLPYRPGPISDRELGPPLAYTPPTVRPVVFHRLARSSPVSSPTPSPAASKPQRPRRF